MIEIDLQAAEINLVKGVNDADQQSLAYNSRINYPLRPVFNHVEASVHVHLIFKFYLDPIKLKDMC